MPAPAPQAASASGRSASSFPFAMLAAAWSSPGRPTSRSPRCRTTSCRARSGSPRRSSTDWPILGRALLVTLRITFLALASRWSAALRLAILIVQSRWIELALFPYAVILQVTPIVAIAPLILIYTEHDAAGAAHLRLPRRLLPGPVQHHAGAAESTDHNLLNLFELYGASRWQTLSYLKTPERAALSSWRASGSPAAWR